MRVIAGTAKRLPLKTIEGKDTRPTTDRIKETLFNMIQPDLPDSVFLDLYSGSGQMGIEALSRGAKEAYFVENNRQAASIIRENLEFTKLKEKAVVMECDVLTAIRRLAERNVHFDLIFLDPPYGQLHEKQVLMELKKTMLIDPETIIMIEASRETEFGYLRELSYEMEKQKIYKTNQHIFVTYKGEQKTT